jgi:hypothetical protein
MSMTQVAPNRYAAFLPALACGDNVDYYFSVQAASGQWVSDPDGGAAHPYALAAAQAAVAVFSDDFETDRGWVGFAPGDTATSGRWERADPQGTVAQPEDDHSPNGTLCWVTGAAAGSSPNSNDVDNGTTTLLSPILDLSQLVDGVVGYWRWYVNAINGAPQLDTFDVAITNDLVNWVQVERVGPEGAGTHGGWCYHEFRIRDFVTPSSTMRLRFVASDFSSSTVEAAVDDVVITGFLCGGGSCGVPGCEADANGDCVVNLQDLTLLLSNFGQWGAELPGDVNGDGRVDLGDLAGLLSAFGADCR